MLNSSESPCTSTSSYVPAKAPSDSEGVPYKNSICTETISLHTENHYVFASHHLQDQKDHYSLETNGDHLR